MLSQAGRYSTFILSARSQSEKQTNKQTRKKMNETEKVAVANDIISGLEKELLKQDDRIKNLSLDNEKKSLRIMQLESKIEVYQDVVDALIKELRGDR
jgi:hypothetical protein